MRTRAALGLAVILAITSAAGCRTGSPYDVGREADAVGLLVRNDNFSDIDVYAIADGLPSRIGMVSGNSTRRFELSGSMYSASDLRIVGTPIGGNGRASSGPIIASRGETIYFTIGSFLRQSTVTVH